MRVFSVNTLKYGKVTRIKFSDDGKTGVDTFLRFNYTTTDAPINAAIDIHVEYAIIDSGQILAV